jgi:hypothetical protein
MIRTAVAGLLITIILVFVNIVGAGVAMLLGTYLNQSGMETEPVLWIIIMVAATWCAITFLQGAMQQAKQLAERTRT